MNQVAQEERRERVTRVVAVASLVASAVYITWRWGWTLDGQSLWFALPLVIAETYGVLGAAFLTATAWRLRRRSPRPVLPGRTVDVFVTTADEPIAIIRKTALAAREIRYPHTTWLLDDGHRDEVRAVAEEIGIRYLRREDRAHAKAGNLNHALRHSTGEFILQLDADHVPLPQIIDRLIGFFADERIAFTQSPQDFYNTDAFTDVADGQARQLWGDQQLFFSVLQPGKDRVNAAVFAGSCAMLRRSALEDVGGFAPHTSAMGTETSLLLHAAGWHSAYLNENLAFGLAPSTAHAYQVQQLHRAQGAMHALRRHQPLALPGLTGWQRLMYLDTLTTPLGGVQRLIFYLAPIVFLTTGAFPIRASVGTFAAFFLPAALLRTASFRLLTRGRGSLLRADRYWMAKFFTHLIALRAYVTRSRLRYRARPDEAGDVPLRTVAPQLALIGVTAAALGWAIYARTLGYDTDVPGWSHLALYAAVLVALWHAFLAGHVAHLSLAGRHRRTEHRFSESLSVTLRVLREDGKLSSTDIAMTEDLTATGLALRGMYAIPEGARVELSLPLSGGEVQVRGRVVRNSTIPTELGTVHLAGVEFDATSRETRDAIELHCAQHAMPIEQARYRQSTFGASALRRLRDLRATPRVAVGMPARVMAGAAGDAEELGVGLLEEVSPRGGRVVLDSPVAEGTDITLHIPGSSARVSGRVVFVHAMQTGVGMRFVAGFETEMLPVPAGVMPAPAPWFAAIVQLVSRYGQSAAERTRTAAELLARGSRTAADGLTRGTKAAAERSRATLERLAEESRHAADRLAAGTWAAARPAAAAPTLDAGGPGGPREPDGASPASPAGVAVDPRGFDPSPAAKDAVAASTGSTAVPAAGAPGMDNVPAPAAGEPDRQVEMEITGEFSFPMELSVGATVLIGEQGRVRADIAAVHAIVLGRYEGTLRATRSIRVGPRAHVEGTLDAPEIEIADGAVVNRLGTGRAATIPHTTDDPAAPRASGGGQDATAGDPRSPAGSAATVPGAGEPVPAQSPEPEEEIFVASPIFVEGVSRG